MASTKWSFEGDYFTACNCDWGCPWWWRDDELLAAYANKYGAVARVKFSEEGCVG
jgi:hypothetical protein